MNNLTKNLIVYIRSSYSPEEKQKTAKDGGETIFFKKGGKSLCYINIKNKVSVATVVIGESLNDKVQSADISNKAKEMFTNAKQFHDGKWLFFQMETESDLKDIKTLLAIKKPLKLL